MQISKESDGESSHADRVREEKIWNPRLKDPKSVRDSIPTKMTF